MCIRDSLCCAQLKQSPLAASREALAMVRGSYALGVLFRDEPDTIYAVKKESCLLYTSFRQILRYNLNLFADVFGMRKGDAPCRTCLLYTSRCV